MVSRLPDAMQVSSQQPVLNVKNDRKILTKGFVVLYKPSSVNYS